jgi:hypothetical protein
MPPPPHTKPENVLKVGTEDIYSTNKESEADALITSEHKNLLLLSNRQLLSLSYTNMSPLRDQEIAQLLRWSR